MITFNYTHTLNITGGRPGKVLGTVSVKKGHETELARRLNKNLHKTKGYTIKGTATVSQML